MADVPWESLGQCTEYIWCSAVVAVALPKERPVCRYCSQCRYDRPFDRYICRLTDELILDPKHTRGAECPLIPNEGNMIDG